MYSLHSPLFTSPRVPRKWQKMRKTEEFNMSNASSNNLREIFETDSKNGWFLKLIQNFPTGFNFQIPSDHEFNSFHWIFGVITSG